MFNMWIAKLSKTKEPLPIFFVDLAQKGNNKDIYKINIPLNTKVVFELPYFKREIP